MTDPKEPKAKQPVRYMDFVSHKPRANADPLASRPASRPVTKPAPKVEKVHSVADQIPPKGVHVPAIKHAADPHPERKPRIETTSTKVTVRKKEEKPYISRTPATSRDLYAEAIDPNAKKAPNVKNDDLALKASAALSGSTKTAAAAPDNNAYSLGGKSPFLPNYTIDKRPLSDSVPAKKKDSYENLSFLGVSDDPSSRKNVYQKHATPKEDAAKDADKPKKKSVKVIDDTKKKRGVPTWLVIIITIILGAAVGAGVYFLLPK